MGCKHEHGDHIIAIGMWVCGQCYEKLDERPKRYAMAITGRDTDGNIWPAGRQEIAWQSEVLKSQDGTTLNTFLKAVVRRFMHRAGIAENDAYGLAIEVMKMQDAEFGHVDYCWDRAGAIDIADEEMQYWGEGAPAGN